MPGVGARVRRCADRPRLRARGGGDGEDDEDGRCASEHRPGANARPVSIGGAAEPRAQRGYFAMWAFTTAPIGLGVPFQSLSSAAKLQVRSGRLAGGAYHAQPIQWIPFWSA